MVILVITRDIYQNEVNITYTRLLEIESDQMVVRGNVIIQLRTGKN